MTALRLCVGAVWAQAELRKVRTTIGADVDRGGAAQARLADIVRALVGALGAPAEAA